MKKYLSKKYIKYIGSLCAVWAALWNVFLECHWKNPVRQQTVHYYNVFWAVKITHTTFLRGSSGSSVCLYFIWQFIWSYFYFYSMNPENTVQ